MPATQEMTSAEKVLMFTSPMTEDEVLQLVDSIMKQHRLALTPRMIVQAVKIKDDEAK